MYIMNHDWIEIYIKLIYDLMGVLYLEAMEEIGWREVNANASN